MKIQLAHNLYATECESTSKIQFGPSLVSLGGDPSRNVTLFRENIERALSHLLGGTMWPDNASIFMVNDFGTAAWNTRPEISYKKREKVGDGNERYRDVGNAGDLVTK